MSNPLVVQYVDIVGGNVDVSPANTARISKDGSGKLQVSVNGSAFQEIVAGPGSVVSVTGPAVDNTDPANPVVNKLATTTTNGLMSSADWSFQMNHGENLTDADATANPATDKASVYVLPANTLTADRILTAGVGGGPPATLIFYVVVQPQTHAYTIKSDAGATLFTGGNNTQTLIYTLYLTGGHFTANSVTYGRNS